MRSLDTPDGRSDAYLEIERELELAREAWFAAEADLIAERRRVPHALAQGALASLFVAAGMGGFLLGVVFVYLLAARGVL